jgi:hypothetical protein
MPKTKTLYPQTQEYLVKRKVSDQLRVLEREYRELSKAYNRLIEQYRLLDDQYMKLEKAVNPLVYKKFKEFINS